MSLDIKKTQAKNVVSIEGIVSEIKLREGTAPSTKKDYIGGEVILEVEQEINGVVTTNLIPVSVFANKLKNDGQPNPGYKGLKEVETTYNSIASAGRENADKVRVQSGEITENAFYNQNKELISTARVRNTFFKRVASDYDPHANFIVKIVVIGMKDETDKEGIESGRLIVRGAIVQYGGKVDVVDFIVEDKQAVEYIRSKYNKNDTVQVSGKIRYIQDVITKSIEQGFGDPIEEKITKTKREFVITSGSAQALDEDESYDIAEIAAALKERTERLEKDAEKATKSAAASVPSNNGF